VAEHRRGETETRERPARERRASSGTSARWRRRRQTKLPLDETFRFEVELVELESQAAVPLTGPPAVHDAAHGRRRVEPFVRLGELERDQDFFAREDGLGWAHEEAACGEVLDAIGDEPEITQPYDLARGAEDVTRASREEPGRGT